MIILAIALIGKGSPAQDDGEASQKSHAQEDERPHVRWEVNKKTDEEGNVIRYDSTYTWSYTNMEGDSVSVSVDSVMRSFRDYFNEHFPTMWERSVENPMLRDSIFYRDFFWEDYFRDRWERDRFRIRDMMDRMDSLRNSFFNRHYPGSVPPLKDGEGDEAE